VGEEVMLAPEQYADARNARIAIEYGLQRVARRVYSNQRARATAEVLAMRFPSGAFGYWAFNRSSLAPGMRETQFGRYLVRLTSDHPDIESEMGATLRDHFAAQTSEPPILLTNLPAADRIPATERYLVGPEALSQLPGLDYLAPLVDFAGGVEVASAEYRNGDGQMRLAIIEYHTPQLATAGHRRVLDYFSSLPEEEKAKRIVKRIGNYVVAVSEIRNAAAADSIVGKIKYSARVYWEGGKFTSIPIQFRPPDPAALEEMRETAKVLLQTFYGIGMLLAGAILLGIFAGWAVFYYRRQRRRRLGIEDAFSDAGGTVRLNLDDYLLQPADTSVKLLGKGDA
jgi:hypothetical protein